jgi:hypothetical protein
VGGVGRRGRLLLLWLLLRDPRRVPSSLHGCSGARRAEPFIRRRRSRPVVRSGIGGGCRALLAVGPGGGEGVGERERARGRKKTPPSCPPAAPPPIPSTWDPRDHANSRARPQRVERGRGCGARGPVGGSQGGDRRRLLLLLLLLLLALCASLSLSLSLLLAAARALPAAGRRPAAAAKQPAIVRVPPLWLQCFRARDSRLFAIEISLASIGSSHTALCPTPSTLAASRFCSLRPGILNALVWFGKEEEERERCGGEVKRRRRAAVAAAAGGRHRRRSAARRGRHVTRARGPTPARPRYCWSRRPPTRHRRRPR